MVRSGGNSRITDDFGGPARGNANNDGYVSDSRVIGVGAVRSDGRVSSFSNPGSTLLVAAPGGDVESGARTLFTTDRLGSLGYNQNQSASDDLADYAFDETGFIGTSGAAPQVSAIAALILSVHPSLHYRDVQHILLLSARHVDLADPDVSTNAAGLRVSHNVGFGIPDAGRAVRLAQVWTKRPSATRVIYSSDEVKMVPEDAMRVHVSGSGLPSGLTNLISRPPVRGPRADVATAGLPLVDLGLASEPVAMDLTGRAALIRRGGNFFQEKIGHAASAGASFAILYNNTGQTELLPMDISEFTPIPAVFIGQTDGEALQQRLLDGLPTLAGLYLEAARYTFEVTETLLCEHVSVTVRGDHSSRGDLRITLISPQGTRSILQHENFDVTPGPAGWTYFTTHHFHESSAGTWTVQFSDEVEQDQGSIQEVELRVSGTPIEDSDRDGLPDPWEMARFGTLDNGPADDPDADGYSNSVEYILNTDPTAMDVEFRLDLSSWNSDYVRLSWQGKTNQVHDIYRGDNVTEILTWFTNLAGSKPEVEWFTQATNVSSGFFQVRSTPAP
jgi:subtilisin-like proprotein convertase family protein